jgi:hypothetical protein
MKNVPDESWDNYKLRMYNRLERGFAWSAIIIGAVIIILFSVYEAIDVFLRDTSTPKLLKYGIAAFVTGLVILLFSIIREKLFIHKKDPYKEVDR